MTSRQLRQDIRGRSIAAISGAMMKPRFGPVSCRENTFPSSFVCTRELAVAMPEGGYSPAPTPTNTSPRRISRSEGLKAMNAVAALTSRAAKAIVDLCPSQEAMKPEKTFITVYPTVMKRKKEAAWV